MTKLKLKRLAIVVFAITAIAVPASWFLVQRSDAYNVATAYISESPQVRAHLGELQDVDLSLFGYSLQVSGARGDANFTLDLSGSRGNATAYVELAKHGTWRETVSRLVLQDGTVVDLAP